MMGSAIKSLKLLLVCWLTNQRIFSIHALRRTLSVIFSKIKKTLPLHRDGDKKEPNNYRQ